MLNKDFENIFWCILLYYYRIIIITIIDVFFQYRFI